MSDNTTAAPTTGAAALAAEVRDIADTIGLARLGLDLTTYGAGTDTDVARPGRDAQTMLRDAQARLRVVQAALSGSPAGILATAPARWSR